MNKDKALDLALEALEQGLDEHWMKTNPLGYDAITAIKQARSAPRKTMPITDDHGKAIHDQRRVIEQHGNWRLVYDQHQIGNTVHHEFSIQKLRHDIVLYPGISLEDAKKRFAEKVEADRE